MASVPQPTPVDQSQAQAPGAAAPARSGFVGHAMLVSALTLISRVTGLLRESVLAAAFGRGPVADAFVFGFQVPNLFRRLFGEGALTSAFIPLYTQLLHEDRLAARRLMSACLGLLTAVLGGLTILGELLLAVLLTSRAWSPDSALAIQLSMVMLPYMPLVCLVAILGAILQVHGRFGAPAGVPIVLNVVMISAMMLAVHGVADEETLRSRVFVVAGAVLVAGLLQMAWQLAAVLRVESFTRRLQGVSPALRSLGVMFLPMVLGLAVFQINTFMDNVLAMALSPKDGRTTLSLLGWTVDCPLDAGAVAALGWAQRLYEFPLGIFGIAIATAIFPALAHAARGLLGYSDEGLTATPGEQSTAARQQSVNEFADILRQGLRLTVFIGLPASVGLWVVRLPLVRLVFERGQFELGDSVAVAWILAGYAPGIWAYSMNHVLTRAFHAIKDARTPLRISLWMVGLNLLLNVSLVWVLGAAGLAWSTAFCAVLQNVLLLWVIRKIVTRPVDRSVWRSWGRTLLCSAVMAGALLPVVAYYDPTHLTRKASALLLLGLVVLGVVVFGVGAVATRAPEIRWLRSKHRSG